MAELTVSDPYGNTFQIDATAAPYWEHRDGYTILRDEPALPAPVEAPKTTSSRAVRPAQDKE